MHEDVLYANCKRNAYTYVLTQFYEWYRQDQTGTDIIIQEQTGLYKSDIENCTIHSCYKIYEFIFAFKIPTWGMNLCLKEM